MIDNTCLWLDAHFKVVTPLACYGASFGLVYGLGLAAWVSPWFLLLLLFAGLGALAITGAFHGQTLRFRIEDDRFNELLARRLP